MSQSLEIRLQQIRRRVRQLLCLYGLSWLVAVLFGGLLVVGVLDWLLHLDDPYVRLILGGAVLGGSLWIGWRYLVRPLMYPFSDIDLALRIESRFPGFQDSLASTVQFLEQGENPRLGSPSLQKSVIEKTLEQVEAVDLSDVLEIRQVSRVGTAAVLVCLLTAILVGMNQAAASTALNRLVFPFGDYPWPRQTELRLVTERLEPLSMDPRRPVRVARGDRFEVLVENVKGALPQESVLEYRPEGEEEVVTEPLRRTSLRDEQGHSHEVGIANLVAVKGPVRFRAVGGDDRTMPWYTMEVVPPPVVENLRVRLTPPAYTHENPKLLPEGVGHVEGLVGTQVEIQARVNKRLKSAALRVKDREPERLGLSEDQRSFETSFVIEESGSYSYWFDLVDEEGFENSEAARYEIQGTSDGVPEIYIDRPSSDMQVTADAEIPVRVVAEDDLGLKSIHLRYRMSRSEGSPEGTVTLFEGEERPDQKTADYLWKLSELPLSQGMRLVFHAEAWDDYDLKLDEDHVGRSVSRTLSIVSPTAKAREVALHQDRMLEELERVFKMQRRARGQVDQLQLQLEKTDHLRPEDMDLLKRVELDQQQISSRLSNPVDGLETRAENLLQQLENNKIQDADLQRRLERIAEELGDLRREHLPVIEQELTLARKKAQAGGTEKEENESDDSDEFSAQKGTDSEASGDRFPPTSSENELEQDREENENEEQSSEATASKKTPEGSSKTPGASLVRAEQEQKEVVETLDGMLQMLSQWQDRRDLSDDLQEMIAGQETLNKETAELGKKTLTKSFPELTPQEQADLARLAKRQKQQADQLEQLRKTMGGVKENLEESAPVAAETVADALDRLSDRSTDGRMREAADRLEKNQIGQATQGQQQALKELKELNDILQKRGETDLETLVKQLQQAEKDLEMLHKKQDDLLKKTRQAEEGLKKEEREKELQRLVKEQEQLKKEVEQLTRRLQRMDAERPGRSTKRAASRMQQAEEQLQKKEGEQASGEQQQAAEDLEQARRELAKERQQKEKELAQEMLDKIADELKGMIARQQNVIDETQRLDQAREERRNWSRGQLKSLRDLAEVQFGLKKETDSLVEKLKGAEVFALAVRGAARNMENAARRLEERETDEVTLRLEESAKQRFVDLVASLKKEKQKKKQQPSRAAQQGEEGSGPPQDGIPQLSQLKMLKTLQQDLVQRTQELDRIRQNEGQLSEAQRKELNQLALEQGELADLTRNLTRAVSKALDAEDAIPENDNEGKDEEQ